MAQIQPCNVRQAGVLKIGDGLSQRQHVTVVEGGSRTKVRERKTKASQNTRVGACSVETANVQVMLQRLEGEVGESQGRSGRPRRQRRSPSGLLTVEAQQGKGGHANDHCLSGPAS